jgi:hypothetical protein
MFARILIHSNALPPSPTKQVLYTYSTTFGNAYGDHTIIRGTKGTLYSPGEREAHSSSFSPGPAADGHRM